MRLPLLGMSAVLLVPSVAHATMVWTVGAGGDFSTIGAAIDNAATGDRIQVLPGTYTECLTVDTFDLWIYGLNGSGVTSIECTGSPYAVTVTNGAALRLDGFTVSNSSGGGVKGTASNMLLRDVRMDGLTSATGGGCVDATGGATVLYDDTFASCTGTSGGAVRVSGSGAILGLVRTTITGASASGSGGGVYFNGEILFGSQSDILDSIAAGDGGGMYIASNTSASAFLAGFTIESNEAVHGGGIYATTPLVLLDTDLRTNHAIYGGISGGEGGAIYTTGQFTMRRGQVTDNTGDYDVGGGLRLGQGGTLTGVRLANNTAGVGLGYGLGGAIGSYGNLTTHGCTIENNQAAYYGGALYVPATWTSHDDTVTGNSALTYYGGAAYVANAHVYDSSFTSNTAPSIGGALYVTADFDSYRSTFSSNTATSTSSSGGAVYLLTGTGHYIESSIFDQNTAGNGGAVLLSQSVHADIYSSRFEDNQATSGDGGALYHSTTTVNASYGFQISGTLIEHNTAFDEGGAIYENNGRSQVSNSWLVRNTATNGRGGAIYQVGQAGVYSDASVFCKNTAGLFGGAVSLVGTDQIDMYYTAFFGNSANRGGAVYVESPTWYTFLWNPTALGNTSTTAGYGGIAADSTGRLYIDHGVVQGNGSTGVMSDNANANTTYILDTDFQGQATPFFAGNGVNAGLWTGSTYNLSPASGNPTSPIPAGQWTNDTECFDDDLTAKWTWEGSTNGASAHPDLYNDHDGDGDALAQRDCEQNNIAVWVGATEIPGNDHDDDCDGGEDFDEDGDGFSPPWVGGADCSEGNEFISPMAFDVSGNGPDEDCFNGDETDSDHDGESLYDGDCDDTDPLRTTFQPEIPHDDVDQNCLDDEDDEDGDQFAGTAWGGTDCNDHDSAFGPGAVETPYDGVDQNCDGASDFDADVDGTDSQAFGGTDCNDFDPATHPGAAEIPYDGVDEDCAGGNDYDGDGDGFVATAYNVFAGGTAPGTDDCDDFNPNTYPGSPEITDGQDNTCDGVVNPDPDYDGDGVLDWWETVFGTGVNVIDSDGDGISDGVEWGDNEQDPDDADGDGTPDALDTDSDNDTLLDAFEGLADHDGDGLEDYRDDDDDGDGILTTIETDAKGPTGPDTDDDGVPDWLDVDSDDDGALDESEGTDDPDQDGVGAWRDNGSDGSGNAVVPAQPETYGFGCGCQSAPGAGFGSAWLLGLAALARRRRGRR